ncbi:MAG: COX15/CtaA family protein [Akkermansiaceae bacterium]
MRTTGIQRLALASLAFLILLIFAGAVVRVTGSGLGCPDWPTCWGELIPPTSVEEVDFKKLEERIDRYKRSAERFGRDPDEITIENLRAEYDPLQTWIEFVNRLLAFPVTISTFLLMVLCLRSGRFRKLGIASFAIVIINALFGIVVVASGLHTGVVTGHMALAFALLFVLTYLVWAGGEEGKPRPKIIGPHRKFVMLLLVCVMVEWALGSQIREMTDELMMKYGTESRANWIHEISDSWLYLLHRSFSWSILIGALFLGQQVGWKGFVPRLVLWVVGALMVMGVILSQSGIHAVVQVLHVGLAGVLVSAVYYWWLAAESGGKEGPRG